MPLPKKPLFAVLLILVLGALAYSNTFTVPFVFDDAYAIIDNPEVRNLSGLLKGALSGQAYNANRYVGYLTFALNYRVGGQGVVGYHLINLLIHLANALLVYALVRLTFRAPRLRGSRLAPRADAAALLAAALFVAHPLQTQAVTYIVQRLTSLATLFYLLSVVLYAAGRLRMEDGERGEEEFRWRRGLPWLAGAALSAVLAMRTKELSVTLPFAALLYEASFFRGGWRRRLLCLAPLLLTAPIVPVGALMTGEPAGDLLSDVSTRMRLQSDIPRPHYLFTQFRVIVTYLRLLVLPVDQNVDYDYPIHTAFFTPPVVLSFLLLAALLLLAVFLYGITAGVPGGRSSPPFIARLFPRAADPAVRVVGFGLLWFFLGLSVESSVIPIADVIFEHRVYLPLAGAAAAFAAAFVLLGERVPPGAWRKAAAAGAAVIVLVLGAGTYTRNGVWRDPVTLWQDTAEKSPRKARVHINLGAVLGEAGRMEEAIAALTKATQLQSDNLEAHVDLGAALASVGRQEEAIRVLSEAVRIEPGHADALNNLGVVLTNAGRLKEAIAILTEAVRVGPENARAHFNLGRAYLVAGRHVEAVPPLETAVRLKPDYDNACVALAAALNGNGRFREAAALLGRNLDRLAGRADARFAFGVAAYGMGDGATADRELAALRQLDTRSAEQLARLMSGSRAGSRGRSGE